MLVKNLASFVFWHPMNQGRKQQVL